MIRVAGSTAIPREAADLFRALTVWRGLPGSARSGDNIAIYAWAPMAAFVYGEHAVLDGHEALLFKLGKHVGAALAVEESLAGLQIHLRGIGRRELLWFRGGFSDFAPLPDHSDANAEKLRVLEQLLMWFADTELKAQVHGRVWVYQISDLYPGSGLNWSGASSLALSRMLHRFCLQEPLSGDDSASILRLAYMIEAIYHEGRASGYGAVMLGRTDSAFVTYRIEKAGRAKRERLETNIASGFEKILRADCDALRKKWFPKLCEDALWEIGKDFTLGEPGKFARDTEDLLRNELTLLIAHTGVPKDTAAKIRDTLGAICPAQWRRALADLWDVETEAKKWCREGHIDAEAFFEFVNTLQSRLCRWNSVETGLRIDNYEALHERAQQAVQGRKLGLKLSGGGGGGAVVLAVASEDSKAIGRALDEFFKRTRHEKLPTAESFGNGSLVGEQQGFRIQCSPAWWGSGELVGRRLREATGRWQSQLLRWALLMLGFGALAALAWLLATFRAQTYQQGHLPLAALVVGGVYGVSIAAYFLYAGSCKKSPGYLCEAADPLLRKPGKLFSYALSFGLIFLSILQLLRELGAWIWWGR